MGLEPVDNDGVLLHDFLVGQEVADLGTLVALQLDNEAKLLVLSDPAAPGRASGSASGARPAEGWSARIAPE